MDWIVETFSNIDILEGLFEKIVIGVIFFFIALLFKPLLLKAWMKVWKWFKRKTGRMKYSVIVTGEVYTRYGSRMEEGFKFEVELPYKDVSEDNMSADESSDLIYSAINRKYEKDFYDNKNRMNHVRIKRIEK